MPHHATLELFQVHAVTEGTDAQAEVSVRLAEDGKSVTPEAPTPTRWSPRRGPISRALNKLMVKRGRSRPDVLAG